MRLSASSFSKISVVVITHNEGLNLRLTVENLQGRLFRKVKARNRAQAVARAHALGLL